MPWVRSAAGPRAPVWHAEPLHQAGTGTRAVRQAYGAAACQLRTVRQACECCALLAEVQLECQSVLVAYEGRCSAYAVWCSSVLAACGARPAQLQHVVRCLQLRHAVAAVWGWCKKEQRATAVLPSTA